jgi:putative transposon-encoded protein
MKITVKGKHKIATAKQFGNGCHVTLSKRCIGEKITIILLKNEDISFDDDNIVVNGVEAVQRELTKVGNASHATLPLKWLGEMVLIVKE